MRLVNDVLSGERMLVMVASRNAELEEPGPDDLYDVGVAGVVARMLKVPDGTIRILVQGTERVRITRLRHRGALPRRPDRAAARRDLALARARGADAERPAHLRRDHRADPLPARGAPARRRQHRRALGAGAPDRRLAPDPHRREAGAPGGGRRRSPPPPPLGDPRPRARGDPARDEDPVPGRVGDRQGPARVLPARAAEGDPAGARRGRRAAGRDQRAPRADRAGGPSRGRPEAGRSRAGPPRAPAAGGRRVRRHPHLPRLAGRSAVERAHRGQPRHRTRPRGPRRRPLRPREGQGPDPRVPLGSAAEAGFPGPDPLLRRPAGRRQDQPRQVDRPRAGAELPAHLGRRRPRRGRDPRPPPHLHRRDAGNHRPRPPRRRLAQPGVS